MKISEKHQESEKSKKNQIQTLSLNASELLINQQKQIKQNKKNDLEKEFTEKNAQTNSAENTTQKNKKHDDCYKNQNIILKKKNITDISIFKIQKKQECVFNHNVQI